MNAENFTAILDEMSARFGATGARLWEQLVRYEVTVAVWSAVALAAFLLAALGLSVYALRASVAREALRDAVKDEYNREWRRHDGWAFGWRVTAGISGAVTVFVGAAASPVFINAIATVAAPEAAVLRSLF